MHRSYGLRICLLLFVECICYKYWPHVNINMIELIWFSGIYVTPILYILDFYNIIDKTIKWIWYRSDILHINRLRVASKFHKVPSLARIGIHYFPRIRLCVIIICTFITFLRLWITKMDERICSSCAEYVTGDVCDQLLTSKLYGVYFVVNSK